MKKILATGLVMLIATSALAHRECTVRRDRYGNKHTRCTSHTHRHDHHDNYGNGFFDGILVTLYSLSTTSEGIFGDDKVEAIKSEASLTLSLMSEGMADAISADLKVAIDAVKAQNEALANSSDEEVLEAIILAE